MIQTGTQPSSTTEKASCPKTTSTCGHTRKYPSIHVQTQVRSTWTRLTRWGLVHLNSSSVSVRSSGGISAPLRTSAHRQKAAYPKGHTHWLPYVITHDAPWVCVCSGAAGTPCVSIRCSCTSWVLLFAGTKTPKLTTQSGCGSLINTNALLSWGWDYAPCQEMRCLLGGEFVSVRFLFHGPSKSEKIKTATP